MPTLKEVEFYLRGLWLLFKQDPAGFSYLDLTDRGALRSFWSILWALPAILVSFAWWRLLYLQGLPDGTETGALFFFRLALVEASNWVFPLVLLGILCWLIGVGEKFAAMVVVTNWLARPSMARSSCSNGPPRAAKSGMPAWWASRPIPIRSAI